MERERERERERLGNGLLVNLEDVNDHATGRRELFVAGMALEVLRFLVLNQYLLVVEFSVAVIAPHLRRRSLLLLPHHPLCKSIAFFFLRQSRVLSASLFLSSVRGWVRVCASLSSKLQIPLCTGCFFLGVLRVCAGNFDNYTD